MQKTKEDFEKTPKMRKYVPIIYKEGGDTSSKSKTSKLFFSNPFIYRKDNIYDNGKIRVWL